MMLINDLRKIESIFLELSESNRTIEEKRAIFKTITSPAFNEDGSSRFPDSKITLDDWYTWYKVITDEDLRVHQSTIDPEIKKTYKVSIDICRECHETYTYPGLYQYDGMDGYDHIFKRIDDHEIGKKYNMLIIRDKIIHLYRFDEVI